MADSASNVFYSLSCEALRLSIEFPLQPGVFGRIGSSPEMEISLPLVGLAAEECHLSMDESGLIWLRRTGESPPIRLDLPTYFQIGPYRFLIREMPSEVSSNRTLQDFALKSPTENPKPYVLSREFRVFAAVTLGLVLLGGTLLFLFRSTGEKPYAKTPTADIPAAVEHSPPQAVVSPPRSEWQMEKLEDVQIAKEMQSRLPHAIQQKEILTPAPPMQAEVQHGEPQHADLEKLASMVTPCVFLIEVFDIMGNKSGTGTGFSVSADGWVATNYHVVQQGSRFSVVTNQGVKFERAVVMAEDPVSDLALLKIDSKNLPFLTFAKTSDVPVGKRVAVCGSPEGLSGTLSDGIISAPPRNLSSKFPAKSLPNNGVLIQTTAAVSPGSSGSPLFDGEGKVLGVMTMILRGSGDAQNLNFAVPIESLKALLEKAKSQPLTFSLPFPTVTDDLPPILNEIFQDPEYFQLNEKLKAKDWAAGMKVVSKLIEKYPDLSYFHYVHGYCALMLLHYSQAEISFRKAIEIYPIHYDFWEGLGEVLFLQRLYQKSDDAFEQAVKLEPNRTGGWEGIFLVNAELSNWPKATDALKKIYQLDIKLAKELSRIYPLTFLKDPSLKLLIAEILSKPIRFDSGVALPRFRVIGIPYGDALSVRSGPGTHFQKVNEIPLGNEVSVVGEAEMNGTTEWLPVEYRGSSGWVASHFLQAAE